MSDSRRNVMVLASHGPSLVNFRRALIEGLIARGARVVAAAPLAEMPASHRTELEALGAVVIDVPVHRHGLGVFGNLAYLARVRAAIRRHGVDAVVSYTAKPVIFGTFAARLSGVKRIVPIISGLGSIFTGEPKSVRARALRGVTAFLYRSALRLTTVVFFQNPDDPRDLAAMGGLAPATPRRLMPGSGVDLARFSAQPLPSAEGGIVFLMIARLLADKGVREFVEAARSVSEKGLSARFVLVGDLDTNPTAISVAEAKGWTWIDYQGAKEDVRPALAAAHVFVLPSYREGTPRSVLEALATGRAVITTDAPGCRETVVDGENGLLVPPRESAPLAAAMERFIAEPALIALMGRNGRALAEAKFDAAYAHNGVIDAVMSDGCVAVSE